MKCVILLPLVQTQLIYEHYYYYCTVSETSGRNIPQMYIQIHFYQCI